MFCMSIDWYIHLYSPQLKNTKTQDNKSTLVHFLVNIIEEKYPDLVQFQDDFTYLEKASKGDFMQSGVGL